MTRIIDPDEPSEGRADSIFNRKLSTSRLVGCTLAAAAVMTGINLAAAVYFIRGIGELRAAEQRLQTLSDFEARIIAKVDKVNVGMQTRLEELQRGVLGRLGEMGDRLEKIERGALPANIATSLLPVGTDALPEAEPIDGAQQEFHVAAEPAAAPPPAGQQPAPAPSSAYQRLQGADGKVYYRKMK